MRPARITILIADDHKLFRDGLRVLLGREADFDIVGEAGDGLTTVRLCRQLRPAVALMDISMPDINGIEATRAILSETPATRALILSMHSDPRFLFEALDAGAWGYILKDSASEDLIAAIRCLANGKRYLSDAISDIVIQDYLQLKRGGRPSAFTLLSPRERQVLQLLAEGVTAKEIAGRCNVSVKTIETHRQRIMEKIGVNSVAELTKYAIREGITQLE